MSKQFTYSISTLLNPVLIVLFIWFAFWYQVRIDYSVKYLGIRPAKIEGLVGVFTSPFIHGDLSHLYNNSLPLLVLLTALFYFYKKVAWKVVIFGILVSGFLTWVIAQYGNHIGASGLVYVLVSFIFFKGIFAKHYRLVALSLLMVFLYGSMIWYVFPIKDGMSWEGHLSGLITGLVFALIFKNHIPKPERYEWEKPNYNEEEDAFMKHFDENGNFIEIINKPEETSSEENLNNNEIQVNYVFKKSENNASK